ncbi:hypothetical protein HRU45_02135 [Candidatus Dependentiae bacterium]|nr:hypothetical protein [Candidatus Dependentiae bacterium]
MSKIQLLLLLAIHVASLYGVIYYSLHAIKNKVNLRNESAIIFALASIAFLTYPVLDYLPRFMAVMRSLIS